MAVSLIVLTDLTTAIPRIWLTTDLFYLRVQAAGFSATRTGKMEREGGMKSISRFLLLVVLVLAVLAGFIFIINNDEQTALWLVIELPPRAIGLWVLAAFIAGGLVGMLLGYGFWSKLKIRMQLM